MLEPFEFAFDEAFDAEACDKNMGKAHAEGCPEFGQGPVAQDPEIVDLIGLRRDLFPDVAQRDLPQT